MESDNDRSESDTDNSIIDQLNSDNENEVGPCPPKKKQKLNDHTDTLSHEPTPSSNNMQPSQEPTINPNDQSDCNHANHRKSKRNIQKKGKKHNWSRKKSRYDYDDECKKCRRRIMPRRRPAVYCKCCTTAMHERCAKDGESEYHICHHRK